MHKHEWLVDVCLDLEKYAHNEGMKDLEALLRKAVDAAIQEVAMGVPKTNPISSNRVVPVALAAQPVKQTSDKF